ncbi:MAG: helicase C-terminal domain-containing protein [Chloroflexota bacterium]
MPSYVILDLETTGLDAGRNGIIEFAAVVLEDGEIVDEFSSLIQSFDPVTDEITDITGITQEMVDDAPSLFAVRKKIEQIIGDRIVVGHNVRFDMGFLNSESLAINNRSIDTLTLATILYPHLPRYGLEFLAEELKLPLPEGGQTHRALDDVLLTAELFMALLEKAVQLDLAILGEIVEAGGLVGWDESQFFLDAHNQVMKTALQKGRKSGRYMEELFRPDKVEGEKLVSKESPEMIPEDVILDMFSDGGNFSQVFPNFEYREQQVEMVSAVTNAFNDGQHLLVEAGTGTGKSVGYLLPSAFWSVINGRRVVVSTATINLQDQLVSKDIPTLQQVLPFELRTAVRKGRYNYLCTRIFNQMRRRGPTEASDMPLYARLLVWLPTSNTGDMNEITLRNLNERLTWGKINAQNDTCTQETCRQFRCPRFIAQQRAEHAHVVVVNHSLLLSDIAAGNHILPNFVDLVIDEAHHLEPAVTDGMSFEANKRTFNRVVADVIREKSGTLAQLAGQTNKIPRDQREGLDKLINKIRSNGELAEMRAQDFFTTLAYFMNQGKSGRGDFAQQTRLTQEIRIDPLWEEVTSCWENLNLPLKDMVKDLQKIFEGMEYILEHYEVEDGELHWQNIGNARKTLDDMRQNIDAIVMTPQEDFIYWAESFRDSLSIHAAPLHVGPLVEEHIFHKMETVVLTSATMRTAPAFGDDEPNFEYIRNRLMAETAYEMAVGSPFDYQANTLLWLMSDMPEPNQPYYQKYVEQVIIDSAATLGGRTLVLFTSNKQIRDTYNAIRGPLQKEGISVLAQLPGSSRQQLTAQFSAPDARAVLLGTKSFWEGVDIPGDSLLCVILAKIPFDVPSDPIFAARSETFENSFFQYSIPEAILRWRQGFGRLIRRKSDEGVVMILDRRVLSKRYGAAFVDSLPECTVIRQPTTRVNELLVRWFNRNR